MFVKFGDFPQNCQIKKPHQNFPLYGIHVYRPFYVCLDSNGCHRYLKHVVMKFICSRGDEALQLVRAISVLLELTPEEERHIKEYLDYKVAKKPPATLLSSFKGV